MQERRQSPRTRVLKAAKVLVGKSSRITLDAPTGPSWLSRQSVGSGVNRVIASMR